jgi:hypothetical protein
MERIQVLLDPEERDLLRRLAKQRGLSLSGWLREAALARAAEEGRVSPLRTIEALREFWSACDARGEGREPDWDEHLAVLDASVRQGAGEVKGVPGRQPRRAAATKPARSRAAPKSQRGRRRGGP